MSRATTTTTAAILLLLPLALGGAGCCGPHSVFKTDRIEEPLPPVAMFEFPRKPYQPVSMKFRLAVINMVDQTNAAGNLVKTIPDVLTTGLYDTARFDLLDRGQLREKTENDIGQVFGDLRPDGLLQGAITQIRPKDRLIVCDLRVTNRWTNAVIYAKSAEIHFTGSLEVVLDRADISTLSKEIAESFPRLDERQPAKVQDLSTDTVTISAGTDRGIKSGMEALIYTKGDIQKDLETGEALTGQTYVGQASITVVMDRISKARITEGTLQVGDSVILK